MSQPVRVAIVGASGIGRHHANWHHALGSQVVAFVGTSSESCLQTSRTLKDGFGFDGHSYCDLGEMLRQEAPDVVDVCALNAVHHGAVQQALDHGCHVLCEKPLVWDARLAPGDMLGQVRQLMQLAQSKQRILAMCSQWTAILSQYHRVCPVVDAQSTSLFVEMDTLARGRPRSSHDLWVDMGPHPLSLILASRPEARIDANTLHVEFGQRQVLAKFDVDAGGGARPLRCEFVVRDRDEGPMIRRFGFDENIVDVGGRPGEDGYYRSVLTYKGKDDLAADPMHLLIDQFTQVVRGEGESPLVPASVALRNLELQLQIAAAA